MKSTDKAGSFERVTLPAKRGDSGAPDSRIASLSTFRWLRESFRNMAVTLLRFEARAAFRRRELSTAKEMLWAVQQIRPKNATGGRGT